MSDLIEFLRKNPDTKDKVRQSLRRPYETYNTLYFYDMDIRLCPKNGCSTIKNTYNVIKNNREGNYGNRQRKKEFGFYSEVVILDKTNNHNQFRNGSHRVAVVRDPVERALSGIKYSYKMWLGNKNPTLKQVIDSLDEMELRDDSHFFTQTHYMGRYNEFDTVYPIEDLNKLVQRMIKSSGRELDITPEELTRNVSKSTITVDDLPSKTIKRIETLYERDYENGWYI